MPPHRLISLPLAIPPHNLSFHTRCTTKSLTKHHPSLLPILPFKCAFPFLLVHEVNLHRHLGLVTISETVDVLRVLLADGERVSFGDVDGLAGKTFQDWGVEDEDGRWEAEGEVADGVKFSPGRASRIE